MSDSVVEFRQRMTEAQYDRERAALRETYGESSSEAAAKRDQALALLFARTNWTQKELAKKEGKTEGWISQRLLFGRFLNFFTAVKTSEIETTPAIFSAKNLTERKFRSYWSRTEGSNDRQRFVAVHKLMEEELVLRSQAKRPAISKDIISRYGDGKWHTPEVIARELETDFPHIEAAFNSMKSHDSAKLERKQVGKGFQYRIFPKARMISSSELTTKLGPILDGLMTQAGKSSVTVSVPTIARLAGQLQKLIDEWTK